jgi:Flp pilus assembly protein CpaB
LTAIAAVVLAALAGVLVWKYTDDAKNDAKHPYTFTSVLVADRDIPVNTSFASALKAGMIVRAQRVRNDLPSSNIGGSATDTQLNAQYKELVAGHNITAGQTLVAEDFVAAGQSQSGLGGQLETDQAKDKTKELMAMSVTVDDQHAVAGFLTPGDSVNVLVTMGEDQDHFTTAGHVKFTSFLLPNLKVLAVGSTTTAPSSASSSSSSSSSDDNSSKNSDVRARSLVTFEVTPRQAAQLVQAQDAGTLYMTLNPPSFKPTDFKDPGEVVEAINLFDKPMPLVDQATQKLQGK